MVPEMEDFAFVHNMDTCLGCNACQVACKDRNNLESGQFFRHVMTVTVKGKLRFASVSCGHCEEPACLAICPNGCYYKAEDGTVMHDDSKCIGCGKCVWACPYGEISLDKTLGIARKCDGCLDRRQQGLEPACVGACINHSLTWTAKTCPFPASEIKKSIEGVTPDPSETKPRFGIHLTEAT